MATGLINANPVVYERKERQARTTSIETDEYTEEPIDQFEIFEHVRDIKDPEHPYSLEELKVVTEDSIEVGDEQNHARVTFTPTVEHCSMATVIGLCLRVKLMRSLPSRYKTQGLFMQVYRLASVSADPDELCASLSLILRNNKMGFDRSKKRIQLWKKAAVHFALCFVMGFFTGFAPTSTASLFTSQANPYQSISNLGISAQPAQSQPLRKPSSADNNRSLMSDEVPTAATTSVKEQPTVQDHIPTEFVPPRDLLIVVTTARPGDGFLSPLLQRLGHTLKLVPSPLLWIVVEAHGDAPRTAEVLRRTGIMYRHLTYKENFTDPKAEADHQRNVALNHVEYHRLNGIVHFADVSNVYDLEFFEQIREIDVLGAWPVVMVSANRRRVVVEGPVCRSAKVVGWQSKDLSDAASAEDARAAMFGRETAGSDAAETKPARINISGFAFNSSILWDPERWGRPSSVLDTSQDSIKFVQEVVLEDETKLKAIPSDCSKIMLWHLHIPRTLTPQSSSQYQNKR